MTNYNYFDGGCCFVIARVWPYFIFENELLANDTVNADAVKGLGNPVFVRYDDI